MGLALTGDGVSTPRVGHALPRLFTRDDLWFLAGAVGSTTFAAFNDRWVASEAAEAKGSPGQRHLARLFQPLGNPLVVLPTAAALYGAARWAGHPGLARR